MILFALAGGAAAIFLLVAGLQRPRLAVFVAAILWMAYTVWEYLVATGVLCDSDCNIRVDLVLLFPILAVATAYARVSYTRPPGRPTFVGFFLGAAGLTLLALLIGAFGYTAPAVAAGVCALALGAYAVRIWFATKPT